MSLPLSAPTKLIVISGPTASGKSRLALSLAQSFNGEIISADSMQIYRNMDIGTAKPSPQDRAAVPHHLLDILNPDEMFSVARFVELADAALLDIRSRNKLPLVVGGTNLYIDSLLNSRVFSAPDFQLRNRLSEQYDTIGGSGMLRLLADFDPVSAAKIHFNDKKRIVRAIEVFTVTGIPLSTHDELSRRAMPQYDALQIALTYRERSDLYAVIDARTDAMLADGLIAEVQALLNSGLPPSSTALQAIGYKEIIAYLQGCLTLDAAVEKIKRDTRRYAKRQLTWLRAKKHIKWILWDKMPNYEEAVQESTKFMEYNGIIGERLL